jgi:CBS domain-containing protein
MKEGRTARDVMNPVVVTAQENWTIQELAAFLTEHSISGAPVVNDAGRFVGVVSQTDITENAAEAGNVVENRRNPEREMEKLEEEIGREDLRQMHVENGSLLVRDIMTPTVYTVPGSTPVSRIARTMISGRVHRLLVTENKRVIGIITALDMLNLLVDEDNSKLPRRPPRRKRRKR